MIHRKVESGIWWTDHDHQYCTVLGLSGEGTNNGAFSAVGMAAVVLSLLSKQVVVYMGYRSFQA